MRYEIMVLFVLNIIYQASDFKCILLSDYIHRELSSINF